MKKAKEEKPQSEHWKQAFDSTHRSQGELTNTSRSCAY